MCVVEGLPAEELRQITSRPESSMEPGEKYRRVEFNTPAYNMLNALEKLGYRSRVTELLYKDKCFSGYKNG